MALTLVACALFPHLSVDYVSSVRNATRTLPANFQSMAFFLRALAKENKIVGEPSGLIVRYCRT
jgi:hypothetical protein